MVLQRRLIHRLGAADRRNGVREPADDIDDRKALPGMLGRLAGGRLGTGCGGGCRGCGRYLGRCHRSLKHVRNRCIARRRNGPIRGRHDTLVRAAEAKRGSKECSRNRPLEGSVIDRRKSGAARTESPRPKFSDFIRHDHEPARAGP
jgi:hypothetical protein